MSIPALSSNEPPLLVGRERELALLRQHLDAAISGHGSLMLIGGEAGIGKTALAEALCREAAERDARVLVGRCYDLFETPPYGPWVELFGRYRKLGGMPPLPEAFASRGTVGAVPNQMALFAPVEDFLRALTLRHPVVVLLDDVHWADPASLDLLRFLARSVADLPLVVLATYRSDELTRRHPLSAMLPRLAREAHAARLDLPRLGDAAVRSLVEGRYRLPDADAARLVAYLQARAEGNALFVGELLRSLEEGGTLTEDAGPWRLDDLDAVVVPALLKQVIDARIARLDEEGRRLLEVAAVVGHAVQYPVWAIAAGVDEEAVLDLVERAEAARVVTEERGGVAMRFTHALVRETLYEGLASVRRRLHRKVGDALAGQRHPNPDAVAYHLRRANDPRALPWLIEAGEWAQRAYARLTAADRFEAALELMEAQGTDAAERGWMLLRLALLRRYADHRKALTFLESAAQAATEAGDALLEACTHCNHGLVLCYMGDSRAGIPLIAEAVAALDALPPLDAAVRERVERMGIATNPEHHRGLLALRLAITGELRQAHALAELVIARMPAMATATLDGAFAPDALRVLGNNYAALGRAEEAREMFARNIEAYRHIGDLWQVGFTLASELRFVVLSYRTDDIPERRRLTAAIAENGAGAMSATAGRYAATALTIPLLVLEGRWAEARRLSVPLHRLEARSALAAIARAVGEHGTARDIVSESFPDGPQTAVGGNHHFLESMARLRLGAALALDAGDVPGAKAWLEAHDRSLERSGAVLGESEGQALWAQYHRQAGDIEKAFEHAELALAHAAEPRQPLALLAAHRLLGELDTDTGRFDDAVKHLDASLALADACAAPFERALTLLATADLRAATGDKEDALRLLDEVRATCEPLGAKPTLARVDALAARLDATPEIVPVFPAGLSAREVEVLRLVAQGLTNPQVAERLFLSPRTVEQHLRSIYNKLGVNTRAAATHFAVSHRLA